MKGTTEKRKVWADYFVVRCGFGHGGEWTVRSKADPDRVLTQAKDPWSACHWARRVFETGTDWSGRKVVL